MKWDVIELYEVKRRRKCCTKLESGNILDQKGKEDKNLDGILVHKHSAKIRLYVVISKRVVLMMLDLNRKNSLKIRQVDPQ